MSEQDKWVDVVEDCDGFWNEETQPIVQGRVSAITEMVLARRPTQVAILVLTAPCKAVSGSKEDKEVIELGIGQSIGVVLKHKLQSIYSMLENQCEVQIKAKEKIDLDNGNSLWTYAIRSRGQRSRPEASRPRVSQSSQASSQTKSEIEHF